MAQSKGVITQIRKATRRLLILAYFSSRCGCTVAQLERKEFGDDPQSCSRRGVLFLVLCLLLKRFAVGIFCHGDAGVEEIAVHPVCVGGASSRRLNTLTPALLGNRIALSRWTADDRRAAIHEIRATSYE